MKITAELMGEVVRTSVPGISYDQSQKEYDANLLMLASAIVAACAEAIGDGDRDMTQLAYDAIMDCAVMNITQSTHLKIERRDVD